MYTRKLHIDAVHEGAHTASHLSIDMFYIYESKAFKIENTVTNWPIGKFEDRPEENYFSF